MSWESRKRAQLRADFKVRAADDPTNVFTVANYGWQYIPVHAMADEDDTLMSLGLRPEDCQSVDCYWAASGSVVFLQICTVGRYGGPPGMYVRRAGFLDATTYLHVWVDAPFITRAVVESVMRRATKFGVHRLKRRSLGNKARLLTKLPMEPEREPLPGARPLASGSQGSAP